MTQNNTILQFAPLLSKRLAFVPVADDDDALIKSIEDDSDARWQLREPIDTEELAGFWDKAGDELRRENQQANGE
ncbi:MAG TPA: hypothetical protein VNX65_00980 [Patescibacteria group bacterium]|jgi:hypothetical protein|nr:hypothetical protein [Patescibacteria group bacterium]